MEVDSDNDLLGRTAAGELVASYVGFSYFWFSRLIVAEAALLLT